LTLQPLLASMPESFDFSVAWIVVSSIAWPADRSF
jgi:hypothetical protein